MQCFSIFAPACAPPLPTHGAGAERDAAASSAPRTQSPSFNHRFPCQRMLHCTSSQYLSRFGNSVDADVALGIVAELTVTNVKVLQRQADPFLDGEPLAILSSPSPLPCLEI